MQLLQIYFIFRYWVRAFFLENVQTSVVCVWVKVIYFRYSKNGHFNSLQWTQLPFPCPNLFLGEIKSAQGSSRIRWKFWFAFRFRETPDILITKTEFIFYRSTAQAWNLASHRKVCSFDRLLHLNRILKFLRVSRVVFYRWLYHAQGHPLIFAPVFVPMNERTIESY